MDVKHYVTLARALDQSGDHRGAATAYQRAGALAADAQDLPVAAGCAQAEAGAWWSAAEVLPAHEALLRELALRRRLSDPRGLAEVVLQLALFPLTPPLERKDLFREGQSLITANDYVDLRERLDMVRQLFRSAGLDHTLDD